MNNHGTGRVPEFPRLPNGRSRMDLPTIEDRIRYWEAVLLKPCELKILAWQERQGVGNSFMQQARQDLKRRRRVFLPVDRCALSRARLHVLSRKWRVSKGAGFVGDHGNGHASVER